MLKIFTKNYLPTHTKKAYEYLPLLEGNDYYCYGDVWVKLNRNELMNIPWIKEAIEVTSGLVVINEGIPFRFKEIDEDGIIHLKPLYFDRSPIRELHIAKNIGNRARLSIIEYFLNSDGKMETSHCRPIFIRCAEVSIRFSITRYIPGAKRYYYEKDGTQVDYKCREHLVLRRPGFY